MKTIICCLFLFCGGLNVVLYAQPDKLIFDHLPLNTVVYSIIQDSTGFLWLGTRDGLIRYDGYEFRYYLPDPDHPEKSLTSKTVFRLLEARDGTIWIATHKGLNHLDPATETFTSYRYDAEDSLTLSHESVYELVEDPSGNLWIATSGGGLNYLESGSNRFKHYIFDQDDQQSISQDYVLSLYLDPEGILWVGTAGFGLNRFDPATERFTRYFFQHQEADLGFRPNVIRQIFPGENGILWLATYGGLVRFDPQTTHFQHWRDDPSNPAGLRENSLLRIHADTLGKLWIATYGGGLVLFDPETEHFTHFLHQLDDPSSLKKDQLLTLYADRSGILWIGMDGGLDKWDPNGKPIQKNKLPFQSPSVINNQDVNTAIQMPSGDYWIGTSSGLFQFDPVTGATKRWLHDSQNTNSLAHNQVWRLLADPPDGLWVVTIGGGIDFFDIRNNLFTHHQYRRGDSTSISHNAVFSMAQRPLPESEESEYWVANSVGIDVFYPQSYSFKNISKLNQARDVYFDSKGTLWVGFNQYGLTRVDLNTGESQNYNPDRKDRYRVPCEDVQCIYEARDGTLWFGTDMGLATYRAVDNTLTLFTKEDGLPDNNITNILEDRAGKLWLHTRQGLCRFDPETREMRNFRAEDGLDPEIAIFFLNNDGDIAFVGPDGIYSFDPEAVGKNLQVPPVVFTGLQLFNRTVTIDPEASARSRHPYYLPQSISRIASITLSHRDNFLGLHFAALNFTHPEKNQYLYKLEGVDPDWVIADNRRYAGYPNLSPGTYRFRVIASNNDGVWNEEGAALDVTILPPWWRTWWAYSLFATASLALIWFLVSTKLREQARLLAFQEQELASERRLSKRLRELDQLKDQFLANTSHELRTPLNGIIGLAGSLKEGIAGSLPAKAIDNLNMIISSGKRLTSLVNDILDFSKLKHDELHLKIRSVDLHAVAQVVLSLSRPLVGNKELELINEIPRDLPLVEADENRLQQIFHNLIGNAIKFTEKGYVKVGALHLSAGEPQAGEFIQVIVEDTGIGIPADQQTLVFESFHQADGSAERTYGGTGLGLTITRQLVELQGGALSLVSEPGRGSKFIFTLPLSQEPYLEEPVPDEGKYVGIPERSIPLRQIPPATTQEAASSPYASSEKVRILVVDDEPVNLQVLEDYLTMEGYDVVKATNGPQALEMIRDASAKSPFDLIILDIMMPRMSGYEVCHRLREMFLPSELPVVMLTAKNRIPDKVEGFNAGANDYLTKPFSKDELLSRIKTHLRLHRIHQATGKFVPYEFLHFIGRESITEVQLGDHVEREVSVLFSDIRDYTGLSEGMSPEENFRFVNAYNGRLGPLILDHGGFVNQYLGDSIMAIFPGSAKNALQAAIAIQRKLFEYNIQRQNKGRKPIRTGIGIHTGSLIMGITGDRRRLDAATIADTVNSASRIENLTKYYGASILISEDTLRKIFWETGLAGAKEQPDWPSDEALESSGFQFRYLGKVQVKGKKGAIGIYECFDGDPPDIVSKKLRSLPCFRQGVDHFLHKRFPESKKSFEAALEQYSGDQTTLLFLNRSCQLLQEGAPDEWDGVVRMLAK